MATGALSSRAPAESASGDGGCAAAAAWACFMGVRPKGCEIICLAFPAARRSSCLRAECRLEVHFGLVECLPGWRMHHIMGVKTANCVATMSFHHGSTGWV